MKLGCLFYVYRLYDLSCDSLYIGKGSGNRLQNQKRKYGLLGEIVKEFNTEVAAYAYERRLIKKLNPPLNKRAGGSGGIFGMSPQSKGPEFGTPEALVAVAPAFVKMLRSPLRVTLWRVIISKWVDKYGIEAVVNVISQHRILWGSDDCIIELKLQLPTT